MRKITKFDYFLLMLCIFSVCRIDAILSLSSFRHRHTACLTVFILLIVIIVLNDINCRRQKRK